MQRKCASNRNEVQRDLLNLSEEMDKWRSLPSPTLFSVGGGAISPPQRIVATISRVSVPRCVPSPISPPHTSVCHFATSHAVSPRVCAYYISRKYVVSCPCLSVLGTARVRRSIFPYSPNFRAKFAFFPIQTL